MNTLTDYDIFKTEKKSIDTLSTYTLRLTVKGIIKNRDGDIALIGREGHFLLPGGGVDADENKEQALRREMMEEIGCEIEKIIHLTTSHQYRDLTKKHYEIDFFEAIVSGEIKERTTTQEAELKTIVTWKNRYAAYKILKEQSITVDENEYAFCFNTRSHRDAIAIFKKNNKRPQCDLEKLEM